MSEPQTYQVGTDRVTPAMLGLLMMMGSMLLGIVSVGQLLDHAWGVDSDQMMAAHAGYLAGGDDFTYEQYTEFIDDLQAGDFFLVTGGLGLLAALGMFASAVMFLSRRRPAAEVGILANLLAIGQAQWGASISTPIGGEISQGLGNTYWLLGTIHTACSMCCMVFAFSMLLTSAGRNSLRPWGEPDQDEIVEHNEATDQEE